MTSVVAVPGLTVTILLKLGEVTVEFPAVPVTVLVPAVVTIVAPVNVTVPVAPAEMVGMEPLVPVALNAVPAKVVGAGVSTCEVVEWFSTDRTGLTLEPAVADDAGGVIPVISSE